MIAESHFSNQQSWVEIEKSETDIPIKKGSISQPIKSTQFPLALAWPSTLGKVQGLGLNQDVVDFDLEKQKSSGSGHTKL